MSDTANSVSPEMCLRCENFCDGCTGDTCTGFIPDESLFVNSEEEEDVI